MADTVDLNEITEYFDDEATVERKCAALAEMIGGAAKTYFFTGAGISTAADIPDFRGPNGAWTRKAQGRAPPKSIRMTQAIPTYAHMAVAALVEDETVDAVVSQNVDGLHRRSGVPREKIAELHGNCFLEVCWACNAEYLRTFDVSERVNGSGSCERCLRRVPHFCHCTSRQCDACGETLSDSIIHFGEDLPERDLADGFAWGKRAKLAIVLGSSLRVTPAADIPARTAARGGALVIVNLQTTPLDAHADLIIRAKIDDVMERVMRLLGKHDAVLPFRESPAAIAEAERMGVAPPPAALARLAAASSPAPIVPDAVRLTATSARIPASDNVKWSLAVAPIARAHPDAPVDPVIASVTFELHPTFSPATVTVTDAPFSISRIGWGTFEVPITVDFHPHARLAPLTFTHTLDFGAAASHIDVALQPQTPA